MNDSSPSDVLSAVSPEQIRSLLRILWNSNWRRRDFVAARYREGARNFEETLAFLESLGWVCCVNDEVQPVSEWLERLLQGEGEIASVRLLEALLECPGRHHAVLGNFLEQFEVRENVIGCRLHGELALAFAPARDFLMSLGAVTREPGSANYLLGAEFAGAFMTARALRGPRSLAGTHAAQVAREDLGQRAELAVVAFEKSRVGQGWAAQVHHMARERPLACYDIRSLTIMGSSAVSRYIEVKAVSAEIGEFYWSASEIEAARILGDRYFLYLLPTAGGEFDLSQMNIIPDPFATVYQDSANWNKQPTHFLCRPVRTVNS